MSLKMLNAFLKKLRKYAKVFQMEKRFLREAAPNRMTLSIHSSSFKRKCRRGHR